MKIDELCKGMELKGLVMGIQGIEERGGQKFGQMTPG